MPYISEVSSRFLFFFFILNTALPSWILFFPFTFASAVSVTNTVRGLRKGLLEFTWLLKGSKRANANEYDV